jgi:hypothetical protein
VIPPSIIAGSLAAIFDPAADTELRPLLGRETGHDGVSLFNGARGLSLDSVAPRVLTDSAAVRIMLDRLRSDRGASAGVILEHHSDTASLRRHLRRFLKVQRERDNRIVFFRFFDPRVLGAFLGACRPSELAEFFGPVVAYHGNPDSRSGLRSFKLGPSGNLVSAESSLRHPALTLARPQSDPW